MKKYQIIYADPPWKVMAGSKQGRKEGDSQKSLKLTYPTMELEEIKNLPIKQMADKTQSNAQELSQIMQKGQQKAIDVITKQMNQNMKQTQKTAK